MKKTHKSVQESAQKWFFGEKNQKNATTAEKGKWIFVQDRQFARERLHPCARCGVKKWKKFLQKQPKIQQSACHSGEFLLQWAVEAAIAAMRGE